MPHVQPNTHCWLALWHRVSRPHVGQAGAVVSWRTGRSDRDGYGESTAGARRQAHVANACLTSVARTQACKVFAKDKAALPVFQDALTAFCDVSPRGVCGKHPRRLAALLLQRRPARHALHTVRSHGLAAYLPRALGCATAWAATGMRSWRRISAPVQQRTCTVLASLHARRWIPQCARSTLDERTAKRLATTHCSAATPGLCALR